MEFPVHLRCSAVVAIVDCPDQGQFIGFLSLKQAALQSIWVFQESLLSIQGAAALADEPKPEFKVPKIKTNGGLRFQSQGGGTPNTLSGYILAPLHQSEKGNVLFIDGFASWNFGGELNDSSFGASTRLGYR